jgi:hypothetical protein
MRIKDFTDTIRHLTDPFNIPEARRMIQENPVLTQEQFKAGGIVEPGVTHYAKKFRGVGKIPPGFISRADLAKLLDIEPGTIMSSKLKGKKGGHGQILYKNITDTLNVKQSSSYAPEFYSKPTKIQIAKILAGTGKEGQQAKRSVYKGTKTMSSVIEKLLENTSKSLTTREIAEKITGKVPVNLTNHPVKKGVDYVLAERPDLKKKIKTLESGTIRQMKFAPEKLDKLANLIEEGKGMKELMKETGISNQSIYKFADLNNLKIIKTTPDQWENIKSAGNDITKLGKNKVIKDALAGKTPLDSRLVKVADQIIGKGELNAARRLFNLAEFHTDGLSTPLKKNVNLTSNAALIEGATKLRNTSSFLFDSKTKRTGYAFEEYIYKTNAKKIDKVLNLEPGSFLKMQKTFGQALPKGFSPDEIFGIRSSGRLGTEASALFVQGIPTKINTNDKRVVDAIKSFAEKRLQDAGGNLTEQRKILTKYRTALLPYKKKYPKIEFPDFEIGKGGAPEKVIGPFERLPAKFKKLFKDQYKKFEYSPKVKKSVLTMFEALEKIKDPNFLTRIARKAKMFPKGRVAAFPLIFGAGYLGLNTGDGSVEAAEPEIMADPGEVTESSMVPKIIKENPYTSAGVGTAAALTQKPVRSLLGKTFRTLGTPLAGLGWAGYTAYDNLKSGKSLTESVVDPFVGMELAFPKLFTENVAKITKSPTLQKVLGLGKFGSRVMPGVGTAITLGSLTRDGVRAINKEAQRIDGIEDPDQQLAEQDILIRNIKGYAGGGIASLKK